MRANSNINSVLVVAQGPRYGGMERYTFNLVHALVQRGVSVALVTTDGPFVPHYSPAVKTYVVPFAGSDATKRRTERRIKDIATKHGVQVIHAQCRAALWHSTFAARSLNIPIVSHEHHVHDANDYPIERRELHTYANHVITIGPYTRRALLKHGLDKASLTAIFHGVDVESSPPVTATERAQARASLKLDETDRVVLCVSRIIRDKGIIELIRGFDTVRRQVPNAKLLIVGGNSDDHCADEAVRTIRSLGLGKCVFMYPGSVDVRRYHAAADVFCHPAISKGLSVMEAMVMGLPVVGKKPLSKPTVVEDGVHGLIIGKVGDANIDERELAEKLIALLKRPRVARAMGKAARAHIKEKFGIDAHVDNVLRVYRTTARKMRDVYQELCTSEDLLIASR